MSAAKPIVSFGPHYSACNRFVRDWQLGFVFNETNTSILANELEKIMALDTATHIQQGNHNFDILKNNFSSDVICNGLYKYIATFCNNAISSD